LALASGTTSTSNPVSTTPSSGYYISSGVAYACGTGATSCTSNTVASACATGYYYYSAINTCVACPTGAATC